MNAIYKIFRTNPLICSLFVLSALNSPLLSDEPENEKQQPVEVRFKALLSRESDHLSIHGLENNAAITVLSTGPLKIANEDDNAIVVNVPIGAEADAICVYLKEPVSPGTILMNILSGIKENEEIGQYGVKELKSGVMGNVPYFYMLTEYVTKEKLYGQLKTSVFSSLNITYYCQHDELGYKKSFQDVVESIGTSEYVKKVVEESIDFEKKEIDLFYVNDRPVGFLESYLFEPDENEKNLYTHSNMVVLRSPVDMRVLEEINDVYYDRESGELLKGSFNSYDNDVPQHSLEWNKEMDSEKSSYVVVGTIAGKEFKKEFQDGDAVVSADFIMDRIQKELSSSKKNWSFKEFVSDFPDQIISTVIEKSNEKNERGVMVKYKTNFMTIDYLFENRGYDESRFTMGPFNILSKRAYFKKK
jgi:hypothetical protein